MNSSNQDTFFAAVGDVHGHFYAMLGLLQAWEFKTGLSLSFVLQVGDCEPHRHEEDVATMESPARYRKVGDFPDFWRDRARFPQPFWFIGGNHEPHGFLEQMPSGGQVARNCHYLGRVGKTTLAGLKVVGLSGIYRPEQFRGLRPPLSQIHSRSPKAYIGFNEAEVAIALEYQTADILLLHDWPSGIFQPDNPEELRGYENVGNEYARLVTEALQPKLLLCGHMHRRYRTRMSWSSGRATEVCCLAHIRQGQDAIAIFRLAPNGLLEEQPVE